MSITAETNHQYKIIKEHESNHNLAKLGSMISHAWDEDPKRLTFTFARYKFVSKMLSGCENVLEIGCGDGFASRIVLQHVKNLTLSDINYIDDLVISNSNPNTKWKFKEILQKDFSKTGPTLEKYDAIYSLDVLEHIEPMDEPLFLKNIIDSLTDNGVLIIGMPSLESQVYASPISKTEHINCQSQSTLKNTMLKYFDNVFMFSMNDEVLHTGFDKMSHYIIALCCKKK